MAETREPDADGRPDVPPYTPRHLRERRRRRRTILVVGAALAVAALPGSAMVSAMTPRPMSLAGDIAGMSVDDDVFFGDLDIHEPTPDEVVDAGFAPDPEFFSDDEITGRLGASGIPEIALDAYTGAEDRKAVDDPGCGIRWSLLAAIGRVESDHGRFGGSVLRPDGYGTKPIRGIPLDGRPGIALVRDTDRGALDGDEVYDRAVGPMQIIPSTWRGVGADGNDDDRRDPNNIFDAAWGAATYLCAGGADLSDPMGQAQAVRRYNHTDEYVRVVLTLAAAYESGDLDPTPGDDPFGPSGADEFDFDDLEFDDGFGDVFDDSGFDDTAVDDGFGDADPGDVPPAPAPAPAPAPPAPPAPTTTAPSAPTTTAPDSPTSTAVPPTTVPSSPTTTAPESPTATTAPDSPTTTAPDPAGDDEGGDDGYGGEPPASVGWSQTMLDFVSETVAAREACADGAGPDAAPAPGPEPAPPDDPATTPAPECVAVSPEAEPAS